MYDKEFWKKVENDRNNGMAVAEVCKKYNIANTTIRRARIKGLINDARRLNHIEAEEKREKIRKMSPKIVLEIYASTTESILQTLEILKMTASTKNKNCLKKIIKDCGGVLHEKNRQNSSPYTMEKFIKGCKEVHNFTELAHFLGVGPRSSNNTRFKKLMKDLNVDISHWTFGVGNGKYSFNDIFCENSKIPRQQLKKYVLTYEILDLSKCSICNISEWQDQQLTIQIDHENGNNRDNRLENLRGLCPNCHSLTPTFCGKKRKVNNNIKNKVEQI